MFYHYYYQEFYVLSRHNNDQLLIVLSWLWLVFPEQAHTQFSEKEIMQCYWNLQKEKKKKPLLCLFVFAYLKQNIYLLKINSSITWKTKHSFLTPSAAGNKGRLVSLLKLPWPPFQAETRHFTSKALSAPSSELK